MGIEQRDAFINLGISPTRSDGTQKVACPKCGPMAKHKGKKDLSINLDTGAYKCWNNGCDFVGYVGQEKKKIYAATNYSKKISLNDYSVKMKSMLKNRGISISTARRLGWYEDKRYFGTEKLDCVAFPVIMDVCLVNVKYRALGQKKFGLVKKDDGGEVSLAGLDTISNCTDVVFTEGEFDQASFEMLNEDTHYLGVVNIPFAFGKSSGNLITPKVIERLRGKTIYIAVDDDEAGIATRDEIARRLGKERCRIVKFPTKCKDANDVVKNIGSDGKLGAFSHYPHKKRVAILSELLAKAIPYPVSGLIKLNAVEGRIGKIFKYGYEPGFLTGTPTDRLCNYKPGKLTIVTGVPGSGKTTMMLWQAVKLAEHNNIKIGIFSPEQEPVDEIYAELIEKRVGKTMSLQYPKEARMSNMEYEEAKHWVSEHFVVISPPNTYKPVELFGKEIRNPRSLEALQAYGRVLIEQLGVSGFIWDHWGIISHDMPSGMSETNYVSRALDSIQLFGKYYGVFQVMIAHPTKVSYNARTRNFDKITLYSISGSAHWKNKCDVGIVLQRNMYRMYQEKPFYDNTLPTEFRVEKARKTYLGKPGRVELYCDEARGNTWTVDKQEEIEKIVRKEESFEKLEPEFNDKDLPF